MNYVKVMTDNVCKCRRWAETSLFIAPLYWGLLMSVADKAVLLNHAPHFDDDNADDEDSIFEERIEQEVQTKRHEVIVCKVRGKRIRSDLEYVSHANKEHKV